MNKSNFSGLASMHGCVCVCVCARLHTSVCLGNQVIYLLFFLIVLYIYWLHRVFLAAWAFLWLHRVGAALVAVLGLLVAVASLVAEHRL